MINKIVLRRLVGILVLHSIELVPAIAQKTFDPPGIEKRADEWIKPYVAVGDFSGVVLIAKGDQILVEKAYGKADFQHNVANQLGTQFRIASLSKTFTAAAIELLITQGKLSSKDHLSKYVTGIPNGDSITVEQLLTHYSGVGELDDPDIYRECLSNEEIIRRLRRVNPLFQPGADSHYSNEGYFLLAMIVEKISGMPFAAFLQKSIFDPLKLANTGSACTGPPPGPNSAAGNVPDAEAASVQPLPFAEAAMVGPGSLYSTAGDLYAWMKAVDTNPRFQVQRLDYPFGWGKRNYSGRDLIEQSGIDEGFTAHMALYPNDHLYAVVLNNVQSGFLNRIPKDLEAVLFGGETSHPPEVKPITLSAATLEEYAGVYTASEVPVPQNLTVSVGELHMQWGHYPFLRVLTPTAKDEFFFRYEYAQVRFERENGKIARMVWQWPEGKPMTFTLTKPH